MGKGSSSKKEMAKVPAVIKHVASSPKFKRRRVSAVRDFSLGYGRVTASNFGLSSDAQEFLVLYVVKCVTVYPISVDWHKPIKCVFFTSY
ncbi:hypothetical protein J1N35_004979 [Gossypium stocksii]|uniref:Uncharacterized protein n=1 Tax=Gossypium stocksii TaxID=47602 RepID=A0A9D4AI69_9ROSI|nr:hypothetical protein J1N35_004979 [Gossypium stocksii]